MKYETEVLDVLKQIRISCPSVIGEIFAARGIWTGGTSARNNAYKILKSLADQKLIEQCKGYFRTLDCKSDYKEHSRLLTQALKEILKLTDCVIHREQLVPTVALRPDALCLLEVDNSGLCFALEVVHNETPDYLRQKINAWRNWDGALEYLSNLFNQDIPCYSIVVYGQPFPDTIPFEELLKEVSNEGYDNFCSLDNGSRNGSQ